MGINRQTVADAHSYSKIDKEESFALLGEKPVRMPRCRRADGSGAQDEMAISMDEKFG